MTAPIDRCTKKTWREAREEQGEGRSQRSSSSRCLRCRYSSGGVADHQEFPIPDFQNRTQDVVPYDFDAPPQGLFRTITTAEGYDEELGVHRTHEIVPVKPTDRFSPDTQAVFIVFHLHQHYQGFQVFGRCFPEKVTGLDPTVVIGQDAMHIALEDDSGYLTLSPPQGTWKPGRYKVEIHVGEQANEMSLMGTMRFTIISASGK